MALEICSARSTVVGLGGQVDKYQHFAHITAMKNVITFVLVVATLIGGNSIVGAIMKDMKYKATIERGVAELHRVCYIDWHDHCVFDDFAGERAFCRGDADCVEHPYVLAGDSGGFRPIAAPALRGGRFPIRGTPRLVGRDGCRADGGAPVVG